MLELEGRAAVITGAGSGIGRGLALEAGKRRMKVAIADIDAKGLAETEAMLRDRQVEVLAMPVDIRSAEAVADFADACFTAFPSIAMMWSNAGIIRYDSAIRPDLATWDFTIDVNLRGSIHCMAAFVGGMMDRGEPAQFVITGSLASFMTTPEIGAYAATKHALWAIAETLKLELAQADSPVEASLLAPPRVATGILATTTDRIRATQGEAGVEAFLASIPKPEEIARFSMDRAVSREFLILPEYNIASIVAERVKSLV